MRNKREYQAAVARSRRRRAWNRVVRILACVVVFCTTYALILPAITLENTAQTEATTAETVGQTEATTAETTAQTEPTQAETTEPTQAETAEPTQPETSEPTQPETTEATTEPTETVPAETVAGVTPNGTVIHVFDYWLTNRVSSHWGGDRGEGNLPTEGINKGHTLKFSTDGTGGATNTWTWGPNPRQGLVEKKLGTDGYPVLTQYAADNAGTTDQAIESLAYLFNPNLTDNYKQTFRNVGGLLQIDEEGYYYYDSGANFAELDETKRMFTLYSTWGVESGGSSPNGQFFPFNKFAESRAHSSRGAEINHYFGLTMTSRFVQRYDGHTNSARSTPTIFEFAGDDDVWVFIDGVLIGDLGGIHDRASLLIDFASGDVQINGTSVTTLKQAFADAQEVTTADEWNGNTFADNTYHTLKFFYLERGNYDSNMLLKYNLTAVPATAVYKTDQYGRHLPGVQFQVYKANDAWAYDPSRPVYTGTTDENGALIFVDEDEKPYTLKELKDLFGTHCVLKETKAPPGYRTVNTEVHLRISDRALWCDNTYDSGVWAMVTLQVAAPTSLQLVNGTEQSFYEFDSHTAAQGTLFAVVVKRVGDLSIEKRESWAPVSGSSQDGYVVHKATTDEDFIRISIEVAKEKGSVFEMAPSGAMELTMKDLPGKVMEYYYALGASEKEKAEFTTAYYWTSADSLDGATVDNTFRVNADALAPHAFDRTFGATIEVPNLRNRLLVQKYDDQANLTNGAYFALFPANENGTYRADDGSEVTLTEGSYTMDVHVNASDDTQNYTAIVTADGKRITSVEQRMTNNTVLHGTEGTCAFGIRETVLEQGCYYLREVKAPVGYRLNPEQVMVRVTDDAVYANAGTANDGVKVACGPGYICNTLHKAASVGQVDNTLTWIYQKMKASGVSTSFAEAIPNDSWEFVKNPEGLEYASYMIYTRTPEQLGADRFLANYMVDERPIRTPHPGTVRTKEHRIITDVGWSVTEIYQDYDFGIYRVAETDSDTNFTDLRPEGDIANLFSRSVYVRVMDERIFSDLEISKTVTNHPQQSRDEFPFTVTVTGATGKFDYAVYPISDRTTPLRTGKIASGGTVILTDGEVAVIQNLPGWAEYTVTEGSDPLYNTSYRIDGGEVTVGHTASGTLNWAETGSRVSKVDFTNEYTASLDLKLQKYATGTTNPLRGAQFLLANAEGNYYCDGQFVPAESPVTTGADGIILFTGLPDGTYTLKEIAPPEGYRLLDGEITFTVTRGEVVAGVNFTENTITVYNSTGHQLPETGGAGTKPLAIAGWTLMAGAFLLYAGKKRRKEDIASS